MEPILTVPESEPKRCEVVYCWFGGIAAQRNATPFQRPIGLGRAFAVRILVNSGSAIPEEIRSAVEVESLPAGTRLCRLRFLWAALSWIYRNQDNIAALYTSLTWLTALGWLASRICGIPWIIEYWDHLHLDTAYAKQNRRFAHSVYYFVRGVICGWMTRVANVVVCTANVGMIRKLRIPNERVISSSNGAICMHSFHREPRGGELRAIYVGWVARARGIHVLLDAIAELRREKVPISLKIVGPINAPDANWVKARVSALESAVELLGPIEHSDVLQLLSRVDVGVYPFPHFEELEYIHPIKVFEYLASGVVPVCTDQVGIRDIITHDQNGCLLKEYSASDLAQTLKDLAENPIVLSNIASNARKTALDFDWCVVHDKLNGKLAARFPMLAVREIRHAATALVDMTASRQ